jgi:hypothetical protein
MEKRRTRKKRKKKKRNKKRRKNKLYMRGILKFLRVW